MSEPIDILQELEIIHGRLGGLWYKVDNMIWGKQTTRKDGENIKYIISQITSIDNQVYNLREAIKKSFDRG